MPSEELKAKQTEERLEAIKTSLCRGFDRATILEYVNGSDSIGGLNWNAPEKEIDQLIEAAEAELAADAGKLDTLAELGKAVARLNHLYTQTTKVQDHKTALAIQKELNKVLALRVKAEAARAPQTGTRPRLKIVGK